jgi:hypothetical protein
MTFFTIPLLFQGHANVQLWLGYTKGLSHPKITFKTLLRMTITFSKLFINDYYIFEMIYLVNFLFSLDTHILFD